MINTEFIRVNLNQLNHSQIFVSFIFSNYTLSLQRTLFHKHINILNNQILCQSGKSFLLDNYVLFPRYTTHLTSDKIEVTISTVPTKWYHLVFNYIGPNNAEEVTIYHDGTEVGSSTQKTSFDINGGPGVVVIGRYYVQFQEQYFASVLVDELLFFEQETHCR